MSKQIKHIICLLLPPILIKLCEGLKRIYTKDKSIIEHKIQCPKEKRDKVFILGNGPTLSTSFEKYADILLQNDCMVVNHFASSDQYSWLKPFVYLLTDPVWFKDDDTTLNCLSNTISNIVNKTTWPLLIIVPSSAKCSKTVSNLKTNPNISLGYYIESLFECPYLSTFEALDKNLISPPGQTVLNTCVWLSIYWGYKETYLVGADTSFLADEQVDQETNEVYTIDTHFYDNKKVYKEDNLFDKQNRRIIPTKFHEELISVATALKGYWDMKEYADWKGVKVYNASEYSWIDAFERKKLDSIC